MDNNAQSILVWAIAKHGKKLATSDSYCQVYLAGYMAAYPNEKRILTSLTHLGLPKTLISYLNNEIRESELNALVNKLKQEPLFTEADLAWGVDAWADALLVPEIVRKHIRHVCFSLTSQPLNSNLSLSSQSDNFKKFNPNKATPKAQSKRSRTLLPLTSLVFCTFMTSQLADGYTSKDDVQLTITQPSKPKNIDANQRKLSLTESSLVDKAPAQSPILKVSQPTAILTQVKQDKAQVELTPTPTIKKTQHKLHRKNRPTKSQRNKRLKANIEAFLNNQKLY